MLCLCTYRKFSNDETAYYRPTKPGEVEWPPKFWKFILQLKEEPKIEVAFVDPRRLARIRLVDAAAEDMRKTTPLKENGNSKDFLITASVWI